MTTKIVQISTCDECPYFDNTYWSYNRYCHKLERKIEKTSEIPEDCPLEDADQVTLLDDGKSN